MYQSSSKITTRPKNIKQENKYLPTQVFVSERSLGCIVFFKFFRKNEVINVFTLPVCAEICLRYTVLPLKIHCLQIFAHIVQQIKSNFSVCGKISRKCCITLLYDKYHRLKYFFFNKKLLRGIPICPVKTTTDNHAYMTPIFLN